MQTKTKFGFIFATLLIAALGYWQPRTLAPAPNAVFKTISGETIALVALRGKPVLVTFWATDCPSCLEEIPQLIKLHQQFSPQGLTIIAIAMYYDPPNHVLEMAASKQLPYAVALDPGAALAKAFGDVKFTPTSFLIDKNGMMVMEKIGVMDISILQETLKNIQPNLDAT